jgi:tetratricopeptide (TPR) repeat protein
MPRAIDSYEQLLAMPGLPEALHTGTTFTLAQLYFSTENWRKAIEYANLWLPLTDDPPPQAHEMIAQAYYQLGEFRNALQPTRKAIELTEKSGKEAKEHMFLLLRVLHYELEEYDEVAKVLDELIRRWPKKQYWIQLSGIYGEMGDARKQLNILELAYYLGYLDKEVEVKSLIGLLLQEDLPYKAGKVLQKGLDDGVIESNLEHWRLLSQAWTLAQEDELAIPALRKAAGMSSEGEIDLVLAQSFMNLERWGEAAAAVRSAIRKGGLGRVDQAQVMLGQALFNMESFDESRQAFEAAQSDRRSRQLAAQWMNYIDSEVNRRAQLAAALE